MRGSLTSQRHLRGNLFFDAGTELMPRFVRAPSGDLGRVVCFVFVQHDVVERERTAGEKGCATSCGPVKARPHASIVKPDTTENAKPATTPQTSSQSTPEAQ